MSREYTVNDIDVRSCGHNDGTPDGVNPFVVHQQLNMIGMLLLDIRGLLVELVDNKDPCVGMIGTAVGNVRCKLKSGHKEECDFG